MPRWLPCRPASLTLTDRPRPPALTLAQAAAEGRLGTKSTRLRAPRRAGGRQEPAAPAGPALPGWGKKPKTRARRGGQVTSPSQGRQRGQAAPARPRGGGGGWRGAEPKQERRRGTVRREASEKGDKGRLCVRRPAGREPARPASSERAARPGKRAPGRAWMRPLRLLVVRVLEVGSEEAREDRRAGGDVERPLAPAGTARRCGKEGARLWGPRHPAQLLPHSAGQWYPLVQVQTSFCVGGEKRE